MKVYTRRGDDGTTGALFGGRVPKDSVTVIACGDADEAQAALGLVRIASRASEIDPVYENIILRLQKDLYVAMAELATLPRNRSRLVPGQTSVSDDMVAALEADIDRLAAAMASPTAFVLPGETPTSATLDLARTIVRRAERSAVGVIAKGSLVGVYLNRLSDLLWTMARSEEGVARLATPASKTSARSSVNDLQHRQRVDQGGPS